MSTTLLAYHSKPAIKSKYLRRVRAHAKADKLVKGVYWEDGKGCAVGCTIHSNRHEDYEPELGIPWQLAVIEDSLFELLPSAHAMTWPDRFLSAITPGADLSMVGKRWLAWLVRDTAGASRDDAERAIVLRMADLMDRSIAGDEPTREQWDSAAWDARPAGAAGAAWAAWDAWAAWAARVARVARVADKAVIRMSEKLLELLALAPLPGGHERNRPMTTPRRIVSDNTARNPKRRGMYIVRTNTSQEVTIGKWDGKDWSLWCEMWDPPEWEPAYCLNCAVTAWAHPGHMDDSNFIPAKPPRKLFATKRKP